MSNAKEIEAKIDRLARHLCIHSRTLVTDGMQIDRVWSIDIPTVGRVPVFGFEVEARPKALKYYKGDLENIRALGTHGVIVLSDEEFGNELKTHRRKIEAFARQSGQPVKVWFESHIDRMLDLVRG